jgi:hypothetical protein
MMLTDLHAKFPLGQIVATRGVLALEDSPALLPYLARHASGDWGDVCDDDKAANDDALAHGDRLLSAYTTSAGHKLWVITEWDRSVTTILLPEEY